MTEEGLEGDRGSYVTWGPWTHSDAAVAADAIGAVARCGQGLILNVPRCTHTHMHIQRQPAHTHSPHTQWNFPCASQNSNFKGRLSAGLEKEKLKAFCNFFLCSCFPMACNRDTQ